MTINVASKAPTLQLAKRNAAVAERLDSWKEIANYLRREVRTVQLWEKREGLPVHRHFHKRLGSVFAFRAELEEWINRASQKSPRDGPQLAPRALLGTHASRGDCSTIYVATACDMVVSPARRPLCDLIIGQAMAALAQLDTGLLCVSELKGRTEHTQQEPTPKRAPLEIFDYVLRWNIQEEAESLRVTATLLFVDSEIVSWSHTYTYQEDDFDEMPADMAEQIAQCLWLKLMSTATSAPVAVRRQGNVSREAYLTGRYFWNQRSEQGMRKALRCFESAIDEDPQFALPYSGLADSLTLLSFYEIISPAEAMPAARRAALKAIELDPNLAEAHASLADIHLHFDRDWQAAECEYRRAIQCNPGYAVGYHWYSNLLAARGQHAAAHIAIMQALEIDPVSPITRVWAGVTSHLAHRFDEAIKYYKSALDLDPQFVCAHMYMAQTLEQLGHFEEALREFETTIHLMGGSNCVRAMKAHALAVAGDESAAYRILHELGDSPFARCVPSYDIAATYAALGESDQMVLWLDRACKERNMKLFTLIQDPRFDPLRHTLQFKRIVERTGLAQSSATH